MAKWHTKLPFQRHWKPRYPFLNIHRLSEPVATDTFFSNCQALGGGTCGQVFYGIQSHTINFYPKRSENEGPFAYEDFLRQEGCPTILRRDNSKMMVLLNPTILIKTQLKIMLFTGSNSVPK